MIFLPARPSSPEMLGILNVSLVGQVEERRGPLGFGGTKFSHNGPASPCQGAPFVRVQYVFNFAIKSVFSK